MLTFPQEHGADLGPEMGAWRAMEGPWEAVWPPQAEAACFPSGTPRNSILRAHSLAVNFDVFQKLPRTKATLPWL